jgi:hypothetical protein
MSEAKTKSKDKAKQRRKLLTSAELDALLEKAPDDEARDKIFAAAGGFVIGENGRRKRIWRSLARRS